MAAGVDAAAAGAQERPSSEHPSQVFADACVNRAHASYSADTPPATRRHQSAWDVFQKQEEVWWPSMWSKWRFFPPLDKPVLCRRYM